MADTIERTIYKLEIDDSGYIRGVESLAASTKKFTDQQEAANKVLQTNEALLKTRTASVTARQKDLDSFTASQAKVSDTVRAANEKHLQQLQKSLQLAQAEEKKLNDLVVQSRKEYEAATKAAQDFANTTARAANLQPAPGQGKIAPGQPPPSISAGITSQISGVLNVAEFTEQAQIIEQTKNEFDDLAVSIGLAEARMQQLNATDEEFQQLEPIVKKGKEALQQYEKATQGAEKSTGTLKSQIMKGREELVKLEAAGKGTSKQYRDLELRVAGLTDAFGDQQARIKILASDTKLLDFGKGAITAATSAFSAFAAVSILAGDESEELQKKTMQLFAAMQLLQSLEQLSNLTRREGVLSTLAASGAQTAYTAVVGASTGALRVFRLALATTGIGAAIVLIGYLVVKWMELKAAQEKAAITQKALLEINTKAVDSYAEEVISLKLLAEEHKNSNTSLQRKKEIQDELQKSYPSYFADLDKHADKEKFIAEQVDKVSQALVLQSKIQAATSLLTEKYSDLLKKQFDPKLATDLGDAFISSLKNLTDAGAKADLAKTAQKNLKAAEVEYDSFAKFITEFVTKSNAELSALGGDPTKPLAKPDKTKTDKAKADLQSDFEKRKADLLEQIAKLAESEFQSEVNIRQLYKVKLDKAILDINKDKSLKPGERKELITLTTELNIGELDKALEDFREKIIDARQKLNDELNNLQDKNITDSLNLLQDEFDRRAKLIQFNQEKEIVDTITANQERLAAFEESSRLIYGADFENNKNFLDRKAILVAEGEQLITNITVEAARDRAALSADIFQDLLNVYDDAIDNANLIRDEDQANQLKTAKDNFLAQKITYQQFQDEIKRIKDAHDRDMREGDLIVLKDKLSLLDREIAETTDKTSKHYANLLKQQKDFRSQIAKKESEIATEVPPPPEGNTGIERFALYAENIGALANSIVGFWQAANQAESEALDRSIALQERRVDAATRIAERGNAQYLKAEEDRLTELNIKRENAARKQLGIDAALQASQILVGITGAIAKIATPGIGIAETIGAIAIIVGALATGYGLVKSLQGNQPKLFTGTTELKRGKHPAGRDTIPAWLDEGEAVIPTEKNKKYKKSVEAIYHGKVPADVLNEFVENYVRNNTTKNYKTESTNQTTHQKFVNNISKIPTKVLNTFIKNYEKKNETKYFKGTTNVQSVSNVRAGTIVPAWLERNKFAIPQGESRNYSKAVDAIQSGKIPAKEIHDFAENYVINKSVTDKKSLESKNLVSIVKQVLSEDKKISISDKQINSFINDYKNKKTTNLTETVSKEVDEKNDSNILETVVKLINEKTEKNSISLDFQKSLVNKNVNIDEVKKYSDIINRVEYENKINDIVNKAFKISKEVSEINSIIENKNTSISENVSKYKNFVQNITRVPGKVLNNFIQSYTQVNKPELTKVTKVPAKVTEELTNVTKMVTNVTKMGISDLINKSIKTEHLNSFVKNYHTIKAVPLPDYVRIKDAAELKINSDGKMVVAISEQNKLIMENTEIQKQVLRYVKNMGVNVNLDQNGFAVTQMEIMEQMIIDKRV